MKAAFVVELFLCLLSQRTMQGDSVSLRVPDVLTLS